MNRHAQLVQFQEKEQEQKADDEDAGGPEAEWKEEIKNTEWTGARMEGEKLDSVFQELWEFTYTSSHTHETILANEIWTRKGD